MVDPNAVGAGAHELEPMPIPPPAPWAMILGAVFGGLTLAGLFVFAFMAAKDASFVCNSFTLLAPIFALGAALSAGFIGGAAAAGGQLGDAAQTHTMKFSVGGGVAVLFIAFVGFQYFKPTTTECLPGQRFIQSSLSYKIPPASPAAASSDLAFKFAVQSRKGATREASVYSYDSDHFGKRLLFDADVEVIQIVVRNRPLFRKCNEDDASVPFSRKDDYTTTYRIYFGKDFVPAKNARSHELKIDFEYTALVHTPQPHDRLTIQNLTNIDDKHVHVSVSHSPDTCLSEIARRDLELYSIRTADAAIPARAAAFPFSLVSAAHAADDQDMNLLFEILGGSDKSLVGKAQSLLAARLEAPDTKARYLAKIEQLIQSAPNNARTVINIFDALRTGSTSTIRLPDNILAKVLPLTHVTNASLRQAARHYLVDANIVSESLVSLTKSYAASKGPALKASNLDEYMLLAIAVRDIYYNTGIKNVTDYRGNYGRSTRKPPAIADAKRNFALGIEQIKDIPPDRNVLFAKAYYGLSYALFSEVVMQDAEKKLGSGASSRDLDKYITEQWKKAGTPLPFSGPQRTTFVATIDKFLDHVKGREADYIWQHHIAQMKSCKDAPTYNCFTTPTT
jgi:hypothetical protein